MRKTILQERQSFSVQKNAEKRQKYSRNETILKIGYVAMSITHAKAIAFCKMVNLGQKFDRGLED